MGTRESLLDILHDVIFAFRWVYSNKGCSLNVRHTYHDSTSRQLRFKSSHGVRNYSDSLTVRSRNLSKSTVAHDAVAAAVLHKHHSIIHVGAGLIQFVYGAHSRLAADLILNKYPFSPWFSGAFPFERMSMSFVQMSMSLASAREITECTSVLVRACACACVCMYGVVVSWTVATSFFYFILRFPLLSNTHCAHIDGWQAIAVGLISGKTIPFGKWIFVHIFTYTSMCVCVFLYVYVYVYEYCICHSLALPELLYFFSFSVSFSLGWIVLSITTSLPSTDLPLRFAVNM